MAPPRSRREARTLKRFHCVSRLTLILGAALQNKVWQRAFAKRVLGLNSRRRMGLISAADC